MFRRIIVASLVLAASLPGQASASDASAESGAYAVLRAGSAIDADLKFRDADLKAPTTFRSNADGKRGWTGEIGVGYRVGAARLEATGGYSRNTLDRKSAAKAAAFDDGGRLSKLDFMLNGYLDLMPEGIISPFVGAGAGVSRVGAKLERTAGLPVGGTRIDDKAWGFSYQAMAGLAFNLGETSALELQFRHQRVTGVNLDGAIGSPATTREFRTGYSNNAVFLGFRVGF